MHARFSILALIVSLIAAGAYAAPPKDPSGDAPLTFGLGPEPVPVAAPAPEAQPGQIPGGVVDADWKLAYISGPEGVVEAIDVKTGKTLFASASRALPLAIDRDHVYVLVATIDPNEGQSVIRVLGMSVKGQGKYDFASKPLPMPEWVSGSKASWMTGKATLAGGKLTLNWKASGAEPNNAGMAFGGFRGRRWGGDTLMVQPLNADGVLAIDLTSGEAKPAEAPAATEAAAGEEQPVINAVAIQSFGLVQASSRWSTETVAHGGLNYGVSLKANGEPVLTCYDPKGQRTLWQRVLDRTPGSMPQASGSTPVPIAPNAMELRAMGGAVMLR